MNIDLELVSKLHEEGKSLASIAKEFKVCRNRLSKLLKENEYKIYSKHELRDSVINKAIELVNKGNSVESTSKILSVTSEPLMKELKVRGMKVGQRIPSEEQLEQAKELVTSGVSVSRIASMLDVYDRTLSKMLRQKGIRLERGMGSMNFPTEEQYLDKCFNQNNYQDVDTGNKLSLLSNMETHYWLGILATDGCLSKGRVQLGLTDGDLVHKFKQYLEISNKVYITEACNINHKNIHTISFSNHRLNEFLRSIGITERKTHTLRMDIPLSFPFIRGVIDGDGTVHVRSKDSVRVSIVSASEQFILQIHEYLNNHYINSKIGRNKKAYLLNISNKENVRNLYRAIYYKADSFLQRKRDKYKSILNESIM